MSVIMVTVLGWFLSPIITLVLPKILLFLGFDASDKLQDLEIHIIPELKKTMQTVDQERMMQRGKRVKTDLDALDKMAAMLRHALEDAEDIFDDARHKIVLGCCHRMCCAFAACRSSSCVWIARVVQKTSVWIMQWVPKIMSWSRHKIVLRCCHRVYGAFSACIALGKCCCVSIACVVRTKSARLLQWVGDSSMSLFLLCRLEESIGVNISAAVVSDKPVQVIIDIQASGGEPDPMTTNAEASGNEIVPVTAGSAPSVEPVPVTASTSVVASSDETVPVTAGAAASDEPEPMTSSFEASADQPEPVTTSVEASDDEPEPMTTSVEASDDEPDPVTTTLNPLSGRWLSCLCSSLDFFKSCCTSVYGWLGHLFESTCFYRNWSYQVLGIKIYQENASLFDILDIFLTAISRGKLKKRIQKVNKIVCEVNRSQLLGVASNSAPNDIANRNRSRIRATSKRKVFGREVLRDVIMAMLRETPQGEATRSSPCYSVIGIYGVAGSGKTTFAGYIRDYINEECKEDKLFDTIMCIHVSETFSVDEIFHEMLKDITKDRHSNISDREELEEKLKEAMRSKRFFLILDDLWVNNKHDSQLEELISPLIVGAKGSKILVTARTKKAAGALCGDELIEMPGLDEDQYLKMFMHYALSGKSIAVKEFEQVGREIAEKLHRSPIAAVIVAGRLGANPNISFWKNVAKLDLLNDTMDALWWSYQQLNPDIRRCFEFCNIFPRRFKLEKNHLVRLWTAQGFLKTSCETEEMEDVAEVYIQELVSSSFLQPKGTSLSADQFTIHDLLHDLLDKVAGNDCFRMENEWSQQGVYLKREVPRDVRHLFVQNYDTELITKKILGLENLRTLIICVVEVVTPVEEKVIESICKRLPKLRVLAIPFGKYRKICTPNDKFLVPESIIQLKHLRYLAFPTNIRCMVILPSVLAKLLHIQLLDFRDGEISEFNFADPINLRHIFCWKVGFPHIGRLSSLQTVPPFNVKNEEGYEIKQLRDLNKLRGKLWITGLENVKSKEEALEANLAAKGRLTELTLYFSGPNQRRCTAEVEAVVLEGLCPPVGLEKLTIFFYSGSRYPDWMVGKLNGGPKGQVGGPGPELEAFPHLRELEFVGCSWDALPGNMEHLTSLQTLQIHDCKNIQSLPTLPRSLKKFQLLYCDDELMKGCQTEGDPNWHKIRHIPKKDFIPILADLISEEGSCDDSEEGPCDDSEEGPSDASEAYNVIVDPKPE